ncbi:hypothetical protein MTO96_032684 [Rhipicephalus appendiculatus]
MTQHSETQHRSIDPGTAVTLEVTSLFMALPRMMTNFHADHSILITQDDFRKAGRRVRCVGDLELLPNDLRHFLARVALATAENDRTVLVACVAYSSRRQVTHMTRRLARAVKKGELHSDDITANLIDDYASLNDGAHVQLLLRTSGGDAPERLPALAEQPRTPSLRTQEFARDWFHRLPVGPN